MKYNHNPFEEAQNNKYKKKFNEDRNLSQLIYQIQPFWIKNHLVAQYGSKKN